MSRTTAPRRRLFAVGRIPADRRTVRCRRCGERVTLGRAIYSADQHGVVICERCESVIEDASVEVDRG